MEIEAKPTIVTPDNNIAQDAEGPPSSLPNSSPEACFGPWMLAGKPQRRNFSNGRTEKNSEAPKPLSLHEDPPPKSSSSAKARSNKKEQPKCSSPIPAKKSSVNSKRATTDSLKKFPIKVTTAKSNDNEEKVILKRKKEQEMLELMCRYQERLYAQYMDDGNIVDLLGGDSSSYFWGPIYNSNFVPTHRLTPDGSVSGIKIRLSAERPNANNMEEEPSNSRVPRS
ncbi:Charged multivesicular body protein 5 [Sesbania bispinosa]|nr:Charged multivesicular body protein 5 [Sesbania bispinosa]